MIRKDRELLTELARLNTAMPSFAMYIMDGTASAAEPHNYAHRLIAAGERLKHRAPTMGGHLVAVLLGAEPVAAGAKVR